ncbi:hypothetical protein DMENIID0001_131760 [Sergentomyia squamirostris]
MLSEIGGGAVMKMQMSSKGARKGQKQLLKKDDDKESGGKEVETLEDAVDDVVDSFEGCSPHEDLQFAYANGN